MFWRYNRTQPLWFLRLIPIVRCSGNMFISLAIIVLYILVLLLLSGMSFWRLLPSLIALWPIGHVFTKLVSNLQLLRSSFWSIWHSTFRCSRVPTCSTLLLFYWFFYYLFALAFSKRFWPMSPSSYSFHFYDLY